MKPSLRCSAEFRGVTFLLRREGDDKVLQEAQAPDAGEAIFQIQEAGNYSCSYRTHAAVAPSPPSASVLVQELGELPGHSRELPGGADPRRGPGRFLLEALAPLPKTVRRYSRLGPGSPSLMKVLWEMVAGTGAVGFRCLLRQLQLPWSPRS